LAVQADTTDLLQSPKRLGDACVYLDNQFGSPTETLPDKPRARLGSFVMSFALKRVEILSAVASQTRF